MYIVGKYGVENFSMVVKSVRRDISRSTLYSYYSRYIRSGVIPVINMINVFKMGLRIFYFILDKIPKHIPAEDFLIARQRLISPSSEVYLLYAVPKFWDTELVDLYGEMRKEGVISNYEWGTTTLDYVIPRGFQWYDYELGTWMFRWSEWLMEIDNASPKLPEILEHTDYRTVHLDKTDIELLEILEHNGSITMTSIAEKVRKTPQALRYHYVNHIKENSMIYAQKLLFSPYPLYVGHERRSSFHLFKIYFISKTDMARFVNSLEGKPFITDVWRKSDTNVLFVNVHLLCGEISDFVGVLRRMINNGLIRDFEYYLVDESDSFIYQLPYYLYKFEDPYWPELSDIL